MANTDAFNNLYNYGMSVASSYLQEPFIYNTVTYYGIFNGLKKGKFLIEGKMKMILATTLVIPVSSLPSEPQVGDIMTYQNLTMRVLSNWIDANQDYVISLVEKDK